MTRAADVQNWATERLAAVLPGDDVDQVAVDLLRSGVAGKRWMAHRMATALVLVRDHGVNTALTVVPSSTLYRWVRRARDVLDTPG